MRGIKINVERGFDDLRLEEVMMISGCERLWYFKVERGCVD